MKKIRIQIIKNILITIIIDDEYKNTIRTKKESFKIIKTDNLNNIKSKILNLDHNQITLIKIKISKIIIINQIKNKVYLEVMKKI
jgi:hypothetical protein